MENTRTNSSRRNNHSRLYTIIFRTFLALLVIVLVAIIGLIIYDLIALKMDGTAILEQFKSIWEKAYVYGTSAAVTLGGCISWSSVKISELIATTGEYANSLKTQIEEVEELKKLFVETVKTINGKYSKVQDIERQKSDLMNQKLNIIAETIYDDDIKVKLDELETQYQECNKNEDAILAELNNTNTTTTPTPTESVGE